MGTPNINTIIEWVRSEYPDLPRIQTTNCRRIAGSSTWSQHAWANAADIFPTSKAQGDEIARRLRSKFGEWIATLLWQVKDHLDHIHVDTWPEGIFTPPCAGGKLVVAYEDGSIGYSFTDDIEGGEDMTPEEVAEQVWLGTTIPDKENLGERTHMSDAVKQIWEAVLAPQPAQLSEAQFTELVKRVSDSVGPIPTAAEIASELIRQLA